ncbi:MAG: arsenate reductase family protein [Anaerocolumna sp.]
MLYICYSKCTTCQKGKKWLEDHKLEMQVRDIKNQNPSYEELKSWYEKSELPLKNFFNTSGLVYKALNLKEKLVDMSEDEQLRLLATDGMLVKRPIIITEDQVLIGFKEKQWKSLLPEKRS